ncbi:MAG: CehA/McbA family metallohydrolase [Planctomycetaceae bacterium]
MSKNAALPIVTVLLAILLSGVAVAQVGVPGKLTADNWEGLVPRGKEVDAIYGDIAMKNAAARAIIAASVNTRNANMTVRNVGGCLIDFAATSFESDQLSCFYPGRRKFPFSGMLERVDDAVTVVSPGTDDRPSCMVRYSLLPDQPVIEVTSTWKNTTGSDWTLAVEDDLRADGGKEDMPKTPNGTHDLFWFHDIYWGQAYGVRADGYRIRCNSNARETVLDYEAIDGQPAIMKPGESFEFTRQIIVAKDLVEVLAVNDELSGGPQAFSAKLSITDAKHQPVAGARIIISSGSTERGTVLTGNDGHVETRLPAGEYTLNVTAAGIDVLPPGTIRISVASGDNEFAVEAAYATGVVSAKITDGEARSIPAKVEFIGSGGTPTPNWGPETAEYFVRNLAYTEDGTFDVPLKAGTYDVIVSHGPEYDAVFTKVTVEGGKTSVLSASLKRSVKTPGWVSADFHSHSSPSGDNTGSQLGRVLNLAAEHVEFAPCTEHNRVSTYSHHIDALNLQSQLATVSGMELTGQPLPLNHQNVFPMKYTPRTQDGGGPTTDISPETQIERIALWDDRSEKLIQQNHPDMGWLFFDKDGDGKPDGGYSRGFEFMDVMEIHPIDKILDLQQFDVRDGKAFNNQRMLNWLQLLNQGFRIYGVVNTDAHYNFHGSGGLRNWIQSSTDDPAQIDSTEMMHASEQGRLIMSNGPYLEATFSADGKSVVSGQDLAAPSGKVSVHVRVQCPNWIDVDTVFVLVNGRRVDGLTFTRETTPDQFGNDTVKFDQDLNIELDGDAHIVVATGHRTEVLGDVLGPDWGRQHPAALTNPVFVDVDGNGFTPNKDTLDFPLPVKFP